MLLSLLALFNAPTYHLWLAAVAITEFPLIFIGITFILILSVTITRRFKSIGTFLGIIALIIFSTPIARAYLIADNLEIEMDEAFKSSPVTSHNYKFNFWKLASREADLSSYQTLRYVKSQDADLTLDYYQSDSAGRRPCIIVIHGGSWSSGNSQQLPELNTRLAKLGYNVASVNYRKASKFKSPAPLEDVKNALSFLSKNADNLHIDTTSFILLGRSAGAQIALLEAYTLKNKGIKGVIDFYGPADMVWGYSVPANPRVMNSQRVMENYLGGTYKQVPESYKSSSPLNYVSKNSVPTLMIHGKNDVLVSYQHSIHLQKKLNDLGIPNYLLSLPWGTHGLDYTLNGPSGQLSTNAIEIFLKKLTTEQSAVRQQ
ncbi:Esterase/lipase/thioesterase [Arcticibacter svalbardensis MN12-7]|uniref:Esterase/lipase/thioesterase n=1 Tax=Arcticibacter svalbardensis MN12-7 TaxID=1150600 RepID=R9GVQ1_9SPHI|nr:alpha/beta hydrolase [Arcticibacter svalbardensis]EOR95733.1 Esterase/lipase/thioesterase [Arcticibacter svalbardensis MN12-7]